jgi:hypothetical protein
MIGGLKQRGLLAHSAQAEKRESITLEKRIKKGLKTDESKPSSLLDKHLAASRMHYEQPKHLKKHCRITG